MFEKSFWYFVSCKNGLIFYYLNFTEPTSKSLAKSEGGPKRGRGRPKGSAGGVGRGKPKKAVEKKSTPKKAKAQIQDFSDVDSDEIQEVPESLDEGSEGLEDEDENLD